MELKDILLLIGGAILGYLVQLVGDRWRNVSDDYELWAELVSSSIETREDGIGAQLEYVWDGRTVQHPHVADLYIWSVGKKDITSDQFDADRPLSFQLGVPIVGQLEGSEFVAMEETAHVVVTAGLTLGPSLIRKRMAAHYRFITDGKPALTSSNPVANLARVRAVVSDTRTPLRLAVASFGQPVMRVGMALVPTSIIVPLGWSIVTRPDGAASGDIPGLVVLLASIGLILGMLFGFGGAMARGLAVNPPRRVRRALRILRRSLGNERALEGPLPDERELTES